jgi:hypothetical protein
VRQASKKSNGTSDVSKGEFPGKPASDSEVLSKRKIEREAFPESPIIACFTMGVKEVKGLSTSERSAEVDRSEAETLDF